MNVSAAVAMWIVVQMLTQLLALGACAGHGAAAMFKLIWSA